MRTATYGGHERLDPHADPSEALRQRKMRTPKGIGVFGACLAAMALTVASVLWMASHIAPEPEESEGWVHEPRDRPATEIEDPRTIVRE